jgi:ribokinase
MGKLFTTQKVSVGDVSGAGDTFLAGFVFEYLKDKNVEEAIRFAQKCASKVVQKHGVTTM